MATQAEIRRQRKAALRIVRKYQRELDSKVEIMERILSRLLRRKTLLVDSDAQILINSYEKIKISASTLERSLTDFMQYVIS